MAELKTKQNADDVDAFLAAVEPEQRRADARAVCELIARVSGQPPKMWGGSIVGFGSYHYRYESGHEGDAPRVGFSPRKTALTLYVMDGFEGRDALLAKLGKVKTGKSCLYINRLADVDAEVLEKVVADSLTWMARKHPD
jgi:hypothetical protein